jgi:DNA-binding CsgD family transcriptional regulator
MPELQTRVLALLELLHASPGSREAWLRFLDALRNAISPGAIVIFLAQPDASTPGLAAASGVGVLRTQFEKFAPAAPPFPAVAAPVGSVLELPANLPAFAGTDYYKELLAPIGVRPGPGLIVVHERDATRVTSATFALPITDDWRHTPADRTLLERLAPHLTLARRLHIRLGESRNATGALLTAFDHLTLGVVLLDAQGGVSYANRGAAESLGIVAGFDRSSPAGAASDERTRVWRRLVGTERDWSHPFVLAHPTDGRPLQLLASSFRLSDVSEPFGSRFARAVFIGDPKRLSGDAAGVLYQRFGLTPAETRLTLLLLADCSLDEAARQLDISRNTARSMLKKIFGKTGTHRQAELVRLMFTWVTQVRPQAAATDAPPTRPRSGAQRRRGPGSA